MSRTRALPAVLAAAFIVGTGAVTAQDEEPSGIDGNWSVDTSVGDFGADRASGSWVGFRVAEVLDPGGDVVAVGRTPGVSGTLQADGTVIEGITVEVDLTGLVTDKAFRDGAIQRALGTDQHPTATFVSTEPVDLGAVPLQGEPFSVSVPGTLTIREISQDVTAEMQGGLGGGSVAVVGSLPIDFTSFDVTMPAAPIVVSVEESGDLEWQLYFAREAGMADDMGEDEMAEDMDDAEAMEGDDSAEG